MLNWVLRNRATFAFARNGRRLKLDVRLARSLLLDVS
jgi:hypothetical protein